MKLLSGRTLQANRILISIGDDGNPTNIALQYTLTDVDGTVYPPKFVDLPVHDAFGKYISTGMAGILQTVMANEGLLV